MQNGKLDVFLAVGHGVEPNGVLDPGAIGTDGRHEHDEAFQVCTYALAAMRRSGLTVVSETAQGASHDVHRPELLFLNSTDMPALIPEIRRVHNYPDAENQKQGEGLAEGICAFLGQPYRPPAGSQPHHLAGVANQISKHGS